MSDDNFKDEIMEKKINTKDLETLDYRPDKEEIREQKIARRLKEIPKKYQKLYKKAVQGNSKASAIKAFCLECCMWQKNEVINCTSLACPLFPYRPLLKSSKPPCGAMVLEQNTSVR